MTPVSLQVNLAPGDYKHAKFLLLHQLKVLAQHVNEIVLTVDTKPSKGRFAEGWIENKDKLDNFLETIINGEPKAKILRVDYSKPAKTEVANFFLELMISRIKTIEVVRFMHTFLDYIIVSMASFFIWILICF